MNHRERRQLVLQLKSRLDTQLEHTGQQAHVLKNTVQQSLSPARILVGGVLSGFLADLSGVGRLSRKPHSLMSSLPTFLHALLPLWEQLRSSSPPEVKQSTAVQPGKESTAAP